LFNFVRNSLVPFVFILKEEELWFFKNFLSEFEILKLNNLDENLILKIVWMVVFFESNFKSYDLGDIYLNGLEDLDKTFFQIITLFE